jgi:uncharacterized phiE125 gp8 family phage protein
MVAGLAEPCVSLSEAQAFVRVETGEEEALLAGLIRSASALCESFLGQVVVAREFVVDVPASTAWERLPSLPVRTITSVETVDENGVATPVPAGSYAIDIDAAGCGWVRLASDIGARRMRVSGSAGMAADPNGVPEPIRQGVLRLVAHMFAARDGDGGAPPAAVTALWRPYRRMVLG